MSRNEYDTMLEEQQASGNEYDHIIAGQNQAQAGALRASMTQAAETTPERTAAVLRLSQATKLPADLVERNFDLVNKKVQVDQNDYDRIIHDAPALADWLKTPQNAAVSKDDVDTLGYIENLGRSFASGAVKSAGQALSGAGNLIDITMRSFDRGAAALGIPNPKVNLPWWLNPPDILRAPGRELETAIAEPKDQGVGPQVASSLGQLVPVIAASIVGGPEVGAAMFAGQGAQGMQERADQLGKGGTPAADTGVVLGAGIGALAGEFGIEKLLERVPPAIKNVFLRKLADVTISGGYQAGLQVAMDLANNVAQKLTFNPDQRIVGDLTNQALVGGATGAIARAVLGVAVPGVVDRLDKATAAKADAERMSTLGSTIMQSKTFQRLPESVRDFLLKVNPDGNVYVPVEKWRTYWQSKGVDPAAILEEATGDGKQYAQAVATGEDISMPLADYASKIASVPEHNEAFAPEIRLGPDAMNAREAEAFHAAIEADAKTAAAATPEENRNADSAAKVREDIVGQLVNQGFDRPAVEAYAGLYESVFGTLGERAGADPFEKFIQYNLKVNRPLPDVLRSKGSLDQADVLIDKLRSGQVPSMQEQFGPSLLDFVRGNGGVQDTNGDLASREPDAENRPFQRDLIQQDSGLPMDRAREMAAEAGYIDQQSSIADFLDKLEQELRGDPVFSKQNENPPAIEMATTLNQLDAYLKDRGIDLKNLPNEEIKKILTEAATLPRSEGGVEFAQENRGSIRFGPDRQFNIDLLKTANLSTFLHESGHFFLEVFNDAVDQLKTVETQSETQRRMLQDQGTLLKWLGVESRDQISTAQHEQFARGLEAYLMEGKAPSVELRSTFARFRAWLVSIYKSLTQLNVELTPEVRGVLDRLVATDSQIEAAERDAEINPLLTDAATYGLSDTEFQAYRDLVQKASDESRDNLQAKLMDQYERARKDWWKRERDKVRQSVADEVYKQPEYLALEAMKRHKLPDGSDLPEGVPDLKLDLNDVNDRYGKSSRKTEDGRRLGSSITNKVVDLGIARKSGGLNPDVIAEMFGYKSGDELIQALVNARPMNELIDAETDDRMRQTHGDMLTDGSLADKARAAVMGDGHSKVIEAEMAALNRKRREVQPFVGAAKRVQLEGRREGLETLKGVPSVEAVRQFAKARVAQMKIRDIQPNKFFSAARIAAREAIDQAGKQDFNKALAAKIRHLTNSELYRAALDARDDLQNTREQFSKMFQADAKMAKSRNMDFVNAARAIAANYLFPDKKINVVDALSNIQKYDPDLYDVLNDQIQTAMGDGKPLRDMTYEQYVGVRDTALGLWEMARRTQQIKIENRLLDQKDVIQSLQDRLNEFAKPGARAGYDRAISTWDKTKMYLLGGRAALRRVESWVDAMDGGDPEGVFRKYVWSPISEGTTAYRVAKEDYIQRYLDVVKGVEKTMNTEKIDAPELRYTFGGKVELLHALLHTGNDSNLQKLLRGRGWGEFNDDGSLNTSRWDAFLDRMERSGALTKADYDYAQATWDLLESLKPQAQKAHREMYGYYFNEVTANEFTNAFGTYRGGYVPAIVDPFISSDAAIRSEKETLGQDNSFMFPTTGRGFTKSRVEQYAKPLALDLRYIPSHIDKVLRFVNIEPRVKDVGRLVWDKSLRTALDGHDKAAVGDMLVPWLQRAATQRVQQSSKGWGGKAVDQFFTAVRRRVGLQMMAVNVTNTLSQIHGITLAGVKVRPTALASAMWDYVRSPLDTAKSINEKSDFMRTRVSAQAMEIQKTIDDILLNPNLYQKGRDLINRHAYFMQHALHDVSSRVTWLGAYNEAVERGAAEPAAVREADSMVRQTQGSHAPEDVARFEATVPFIRAFNMFSSYFNMQANLLGTEFSKIATNEMGLRKGAGRALYVYTMGFMAPAVLYEAVRTAMAGGIDKGDDESYLPSILEIFFGSQLKSAAAMVPIAGPMVNAMVGKFTKAPGDDDIRVSPAITSIESAVHAPADVYKALSKKELDATEVKDTLTAIGLLSGVPTGPISNAAQYAVRVKQQKVQRPKNTVDAVRGALSGTGPKLP